MSKKKAKHKNRIFIFGIRKGMPFKKDCIEKFEMWQRGMPMSDISVPREHKPQFGDLIGFRQGNKHLITNAEWRVRWVIYDRPIVNKDW